MNESAHMPRPGLQFTLMLAAMIDELPVDGRQILAALRTPALGLCQACAHQECTAFRTVGCILPPAAGGFEPSFPSQEFVLGSNPISQLAPSPQDDLMRHLGVIIPGVGCCRNEKTVRMIG